MRMTLGARNAVEVRWRALPLQLPALLSYWRASAPASLARISTTWRYLVAGTHRHYGALVEASGAGNLISKDGYWEAHGLRASLDVAVAVAERRWRDYGTGYLAMDEAALRRAEPALKPGLAGAVKWTSPWACPDPGVLTAAYATLFERQGGGIVAGDASSLARSGRGWRSRAGALNGERSGFARARHSSLQVQAKT